MCCHIILRMNGGEPGDVGVFQMQSLFSRLHVCPLLIQKSTSTKRESYVPQYLHLCSGPSPNSFISEF